MFQFLQPLCWLLSLLHGSSWPNLTTATITSTKGTRCIKCTNQLWNADRAKEMLGEKRYHTCRSPNPAISQPVGLPGYFLYPVCKLKAWHELDLIGCFLESYCYYSFVPDKVLTWDVGKITPQKLPNLKGIVNLQSGAPKPEENPSLNIQFKIQQLAISGEWVGITWNCHWWNE